MVEKLNKAGIAAAGIDLQGNFTDTLFFARKSHHSQGSRKCESLLKEKRMGKWKVVHYTEDCQKLAWDLKA